MTTSAKRKEPRTAYFVRGSGRLLRSGRWRSRLSVFGDGFQGVAGQLLVTAFHREIA